MNFKKAVFALLLLQTSFAMAQSESYLYDAETDQGVTFRNAIRRTTNVCNPSPGDGGFVNFSTTSFVVGGTYTITTPTAVLQNTGAEYRGFVSYTLRVNTPSPSTTWKLDVELAQGANLIGVIETVNGTGSQACQVRNGGGSGIPIIQPLSGGSGYQIRFRISILSGGSALNIYYLSLDNIRIDYLVALASPLSASGLTAAYVTSSVENVVKTPSNQVFGTVVLYKGGQSPLSCPGSGTAAAWCQRSGYDAFYEVVKINKSTGEAESLSFQTLWVPNQGSEYFVRFPNSLLEDNNYEYLHVFTVITASYTRNADGTVSNIQYTQAPVRKVITAISRDVDLITTTPTMNVATGSLGADLFTTSTLACDNAESIYLYDVYSLNGFSLNTRVYADPLCTIPTDDATGTQWAVMYYDNVYYAVKVDANGYITARKVCSGR